MRVAANWTLSPAHDRMAKGRLRFPGAEKSRGSSLRVWRRASILGAFLLLLGGRTAQTQQAEEYRVKAAFLFHFAQLVDWPAEVLGDEKNPFTVCTLGKDTFGGDLDTTLQGKSIGTRALRVRHLKQAQEAQGCLVLFVGGNERKEVAPLLAALKDQAILTVGESDDFAKQGGMIGFLMDSNKVRFDINTDAASRAKLKISARLLLLAKTVIGNHS